MSNYFFMQFPCTQEPVKAIGIDEIAMHKGHQDFILILTDLSNKRVLEVLKDRKKETLEKCLDKWTNDFKKTIEFVAIDLWRPYRAAIEHILPNAQIVADRFHVMKNLNRCLDKCRKQENIGGKGAKYLLLRNGDSLNSDQKNEVKTFLNQSKKLKKLYQFKENFRSIFNRLSTKPQARQELSEWILNVIRHQSYHCFSFVKTLLKWKEPILNYFIKRLTSGFVEGVNNKIKLIKRKAYGFRNFENFKLKIIDAFN